MASPPSEAKRRIDDEFNRLTANGTRPFPGGTEGFLKFQREQGMQQPTQQPTQQSMQQGAGGARLPIGVGPSMPDPRIQQLAGQFGQQAAQQLFGRPTSMPPTQGPRVQQAAQQTAGAALQGFANKAGGFFKKGGAVTAKSKAPVKKAAGGKVAAKAPVKKAMGGKVAAKPMGKPVMKKAGGRVAAKPMMKGRKK